MFFPMLSVLDLQSLEKSQKTNSFCSAVSPNSPIQIALVILLWILLKLESSRTAGRRSDRLLRFPSRQAGDRIQYLVSAEAVAWPRATKQDQPAAMGQNSDMGPEEKPNTLAAGGLGRSWPILSHMEISSIDPESLLSLLLTFACGAAPCHQDSISIKAGLSLFFQPLSLRKRQILYLE